MAWNKTFYDAIFENKETPEHCHFLEPCSLWEKEFCQSNQRVDCNPADIYLFEDNSGNTKTMYEIYLKLTVKTPEWRQYVILVSWLLTSNRFYMCFYWWLRVWIPHNFRRTGEFWSDIFSRGWAFLKFKGGYLLGGPVSSRGDLVLFGL